MANTKSKILIMTDSSAGISQAEAAQLGIVVVPIPFTIDGTEYLEDVSITQKDFFHKLEQGAGATTSQPSRYYLEELWREKLREYDQFILLPFTSCIRADCPNACR